MKLRDLALPESRFFLKAEYGPLSQDWPVVASSNRAFENQMHQDYTSDQDWIVYLGTKGEHTNEEFRGRLLSVSQIDITHVEDTYKHLSPGSLAWAQKDFPGKWLRCFEVIRVYDFSTRPLASSVLQTTDLNLWHSPSRQIENTDLDALLELELAPLEWLDIRRRETCLLERRTPDTEHISASQALDREALRLALLASDRISSSGQIVSRTAPERTGPLPAQLQAQIRTLLEREPRVCALCGGHLPLLPKNKLMKVSGDRIDSSLPSYGLENYQIVHYACNLAKNDATANEFSEWLGQLRSQEIKTEVKYA
jgi:hypothetical protein